MSQHSPYQQVAPPRRPRLSDSIVEQVEQLIVQGVLKPGHELPAERLLAQQFGVSRPSLREALLLLESRGLLTLARGGGFMVADVTAPTLTNPLVHLLQAHESAELDVLELRHGLELVAAYFAALRATDEDRLRLQQAFDRLSGVPDDASSMHESLYDAEFHMAVAEASHNVALVHVMHGLHNLLRTSMRHAWEVMQHEPGHVELIRGQHRALLDAVLDGDAERARDAAHLHLNFLRETLLQVGSSARGKQPAPAPPATRMRKSRR